MSTLIPQNLDLEYFKDDFEAALRFVLGDEYASRAPALQEVLDGIRDHSDGQQALAALEAQLGGVMFSHVLRFHIENKTELRGDAEALVFPL